MARPNASATTHKGYHEFIAEDDPSKRYGHFEVYWFESHDPKEDGWYWHACFPGCLPDGDASGPFLSSRAAYKNAQGE